MFKKVFTGIKGFDSIVGGGFPISSMVLVTGPAGVGKTTFGIQFLVKGAELGEPGLYISMEEDVEKLHIFEYLFGFNISKFENEKKIKIVRFELMEWKELYSINRLEKMIDKLINKINAKRVVLDSSSILGYYLKNEFNLRRFLFSLSKKFEKHGITSIIISDIPYNSNKLSTFGVEEFVSDGIILLSYSKIKTYFNRRLEVKKLRFTDFSNFKVPFQIGREGIEVFPTQEIF